MFLLKLKVSEAELDYISAFRFHPLRLRVHYFRLPNMYHWISNKEGYAIHIRESLLHLLQPVRA